VLLNKSGKSDRAVAGRDGFQYGLDRLIEKRALVHGDLLVGVFSVFPDCRKKIDQPDLAEVPGREVSTILLATAIMRPSSSGRKVYC